MKTNNLTVHEALSASHRKENETIYGKIQQLTIWVMTYGKWMNENYGKEVGIDL